MPKVLNKYVHGTPLGSVYVGRPSQFGNPFVIGKDGNRAEVMKKYEERLMTRPVLVKEAKEKLKGKDLVCFCSPKECHADILLKIANEAD